MINIISDNRLIHTLELLNWVVRFIPDFTFTLLGWLNFSIRAKRSIMISWSSMEKDSKGYFTIAY